MEPEHQLRELADQIFSDATELAPGERDAFVARQCAGDESLARAVREILAQFQQLGSFLDKPAAAGVSHPFNRLPEGTILSGRFRLIQHLGEGGMGVVYRADDLELGEQIALKMVRDVWLDDPAVLARFRDEIRLARKIGHRNICRIYDLYTDTIEGRPRAFFTMEYLEGQSVAELRKEVWRPDAAEILTLALGIAAGLDAAHGAGIVHRDLKPANILITRTADGGQRPVIMDFGLAQALTSDSGAVTQTGQIVGSPDYMAPEQFLGERATVAADVFSLAVIIYELAAGARPWPSESLFRAAVRRVNGQKTSLQATEGVPVRWIGPLERALERDPARRPRSAGELVRQLELALGKKPPVKLPVISRRALITGAGGTVVAAGVSAFLVISRFREQHRENLVDPVVMLMPVEAYAGYEDAKALDYLMRTQLLQSAHVKVVDMGTIERAWTRMHGGKTTALPVRFDAAGAREIAQFSGARFVVFSSIAKTGDDIRLEVKREELGVSRLYPGLYPGLYPWLYPSTMPSKEFHVGDERALMSATRDAANWLRQQLGEVARDIQANAFPVEELTTGNWEALREFVRAGEIWRVSPQGKGSEESIRHLRRALELDPGFALAAARLGDHLVALGQTDEGLRYQQAGVELMDQRNLTDRESLRIRGNYYQDTGQDEKADAIFSTWTDRYPGDALPLFFRGFSLLRMGRADEAWALRARAARLAPDNYAVNQGAAMALLEAGRLDEAAAKCVTLAPNDFTDQTMCGVAFGRYDLRGVRQAIDRMEKNGSLPFQCKAWAFRACLFAETGHGEEAEKAIDLGIRLAVENTLTGSIFANRLIRAQLLIRLGRNADAVTECRKILEVEKGAESRMRTGCLLAQAGEVQLAESLLTTTLRTGDRAWLATPRFEHWRRRLKAEILMARGKTADAARLLDDVPPLLSPNEWPEYHVRVLLAAGRMDEAGELISPLFRHPGRYWYGTDVTGAGFFRWAVESAMRYRFGSVISGPLQLLKTILFV